MQLHMGAIHSPVIYSWNCASTGRHASSICRAGNHREDILHLLAGTVCRSAVDDHHALHRLPPHSALLFRTSDRVSVLPDGNAEL